MNIAIFGAGVAGLATAVALQAVGHRCRIYERRVRHLSSGMAFILMPDAMQSLRALGVRTDKASPLRRYIHRDAGGHPTGRHVLPADVHCYQRSHLLDALCEALPGDALGMTQGGLSHFQFDDWGGVSRAWMANGASVVADLYVAADGSRSQTRAALFPQWPHREARVLEMVGLVEDRGCADWAGNDFNKFHAGDGGKAFGLLPVHGDTLVWYMQFDAALMPAGGLKSGSEKQAFAQGQLKGWGFPVAQALAASDFSQAHLWRPVDTDLVPAFHRGNLVLAGDAAHPLLPFSSQGVSAAILDAVALSVALRHGQALSPALARYSAQRRQACLPFVAKGRELTDRFFKPASGDAIPIAH